jgi:hypothetical protein
MKRFILVASFLTVSVASQAQEAWIELLRSDIRTEKVALITAAMGLTDAQSTVFWPVYREYELELSKLGDKKLAIIKEYAEQYHTLTDEQAKGLMDRNFKVQEDQLKLRKKYFKNLQKVIPASLAARAVQLENQVGRLIDIQIASELPLVEQAKEAVEP